MSALGELLSYARNEEEQRGKLELEKQLFPLWLANYALAKIQGREEVMDFEEFVNQTFEPAAVSNKKQAKTAEDITAEFMPIVEADKKRGG